MKNILKYYLIIVGFLTTMFMVFFVIFIFGLVKNIEKISTRLTEKEKVLADKPYYLKLNLVGDIQDSEVSEFNRLIQLIEKRPSYQLYDLITIIDRASGDDRIQGLVIKNLKVDASLNSVFELSDALKRFRQQDKKVYIFLSEADNKNYLLASAADQIFFQKEGNLYIPGVSGSFIYVKDTLAKIGVEADFLREGRYKSAPETFTSNVMPKNTRKVYTELFGDIQETFIQTISENRNLTREEVTGCLNKALITPEEALQRKLVDKLSYNDDFLETVEKELFPEIDSLNFSAYARVSPKSIKGVRVDTHNKIAIIIANGTIQMAPQEHQMKETLIWPEQVLRKLEQVEEEPDIKALILRVNSPGGSALASDIIWNAVRKLNAKKPVFASMGSVAASGGYYISMGAEQIYADRTTLTGSIGVFGGKFVVSDLLNKIGAHTETIAFSDGASLFSPIQNFTPSQRQDFEAFLHNTYQGFVTKAAISRNKEYKELDKAAQGRVWSGQQALQVGLVDGIGGYYEVIQAVKEKLGLGKNVLPTIVRIRSETGDLVDLLHILSPFTKELSPFTKESPSSLLMDADMRKKVDYLKTMNDLIYRERSLYLMPYFIEIQ